MSELLETNIINSLAAQVHATACAKGWHDALCNDGEPTNERIGAWVALMHAELSEALEELRKGGSLKPYTGEGGKPEGFVIELADCVIRIMDCCEALGINLGEAIIRKMEYNETRPHRHGGKAL